SATSLEFNKNEDQNKQLWDKVKSEFAKITLGGGEKSAAKQKAKGKMLARERVDYLLDKDKPFVEIGAFTAYEIYEEYGGCPSAVVVAGIGYISGKQCMVVANDATVQAGAWFPLAAKRILRAQDIGMENRLPIINLVDSA